MFYVPCSTFFYNSPMLDIALRNLAFGYDRGFAMRDVTVTFARSTHTAIVGPA